MDKIFCHIVGLNDELKKKISSILNSNDFSLEIIDLDIITQKVINDKYMNLMYNKYEQLFEKSKQKGSDKSLNLKYKEIEKKMNQYWKNKFEIILKRECNKVKADKIILLGLNVHFKNNRINVKINTKLKFFARLNLNDNAKKIIESNIDNHRDEIIAGTFPLQYLDPEFLIKKRNSLQQTFEKLKYEVKTITTIITIIINNINSTNLPQLFLSSYEKYEKKINTNERLIAYSIPWLSIISLEKGFKKGFKKNNAFIKETNEFQLKDLNKFCYLYQVDDTSFYLHENGQNIKFASVEDAIIINTYYIENIYEYMKDNGIKLLS